jgi:hypothetical protein
MMFVLKILKFFWGLKEEVQGVSRIFSNQGYEFLEENSLKDGPKSKLWSFLQGLYGYLQTPHILHKVRFM